MKEELPDRSKPLSWKVHFYLVASLIGCPILANYVPLRGLAYAFGGPDSILKAWWISVVVWCLIFLRVLLRSSGRETLVVFLYLLVSLLLLASAGRLVHAIFIWLPIG